jgi:precorrin-6Y C5,15-methyltransferase (decarboxylating)
MTVSIHIVGLGVSEKAHLNESAKQALAQAQWVIASPRQLNVVSDLLSGQQTKQLPPLPELLTWINNLDDEKAAGQQSNIVVLASGDPLFYGIGAWFSRNFKRECIHFYPAVSSIQAACHALGLSLQDVEVLSLHGRPLQKIRSHLKRNQTTVVLTDKHSGPCVLAKECIQAGFDHSIITVCESLGYKNQQVRSFNVIELKNSNIEFDALHVSVIQTKGAGMCRPEFPGFNDEWFVTDANNDKKIGTGMITKREVRLNILSLLQPANHDVIWDIGAGCGSVAVELAYWNNKCQVHAIEHHPERLKCLEDNRQKFGVVANLKVVAARAPLALADLPIANKIFIGGSDGELTELLSIAWNTLPMGGTLVASSVMETSKLLLVQFLQLREQECDALSETSQIAISRGGRLAGQLLYRPSLPVTLFKFVKQGGSSYV